MWAFVISGSSTFGGANVSVMTVSAVTGSGRYLVLTLPTGQTFSSTITNQAAGASSTCRQLSFIRSSYNVSSITKNGTGDYTVNFATPMADANYTATAGSYLFGAMIISLQFLSKTTTGVRLVAYGDVTGANNGFAADMTDISMQIFGN